MADAAWANPVVARLAGGARDGERSGLVLTVAWPMPPAVRDQYAAFAERLRRAMPAEAYIYPPESLHCTVCTMRAFTAGALDHDAGREIAYVWQRILDRARAMSDWPSAPFSLTMCAPTLEGAAAIFHYVDDDDGVEQMRECVRRAIEEAGGIAAVGASDRSLARAPDALPRTEPPPHIPDIIHSTAMRWAAEPSAPRAEVRAAFDAVAATWEPIALEVRCARAVVESAPYMHIMPLDEAGGGDAHVFWRSADVSLLRSAWNVWFFAVLAVLATFRRTMDIY